LSPTCRVKSQSYRGNHEVYPDLSGPSLRIMLLFSPFLRHKYMYKLCLYKLFFLSCRYTFSMIRTNNE
jgi:hypothetical protein